MVVDSYHKARGPSLRGRSTDMGTRGDDCPALTWIDQGSCSWSIDIPVNGVLILSKATDVESVDDRRDGRWYPYFGTVGAMDTGESG